VGVARDWQGASTSSSCCDAPGVHPLLLLLRTQGPCHKSVGSSATAGVVRAQQCLQKAVPAAHRGSTRAPSSQPHTRTPVPHPAAQSLACPS
jgi:hypothetical protein